MKNVDLMIENLIQLTSKDKIDWEGGDYRGTLGESFRTKINHTYIEIHRGHLLRWCMAFYLNRVKIKISDSEKLKELWETIQSYHARTRIIKEKKDSLKLKKTVEFLATLKI